MSFLRTELKSGLTVIGEHNPSARSMAVGYFVRTGARDEWAGVSGVSHFLEHMLFKGTDRRSADDVNREFDEIGAQYNAFTSEENTVYYGAVLPEFQHRVVDLLTDMMRPALRDSDFTMEKNVILEEIALYRDRPQFTVMDEARATYFGAHPLAQPVLGTDESIKALTHDQMRDYWRSRYAANNLILAAAGNFEWEALLHDLEHRTHSWRAAEVPRELASLSPVPQVRTIRNEKFNRAHVTFVAPGVPAQSDDRYAAAILGSAVGSSEGSRLYWELVDPGIADTARAFHDEMDGVGAFFTYVSCEPQRAQEIVDRVRGLYASVRSSGLTADEVERTKRKFASSIVFDAETPFGRLLHLGFDWQYRRELRTADESIDAILAVDTAQVNDLLGRLDFDRPTVVALGSLDDLR